MFWKLSITQRPFLAVKCQKLGLSFKSDPEDKGRSSQSRVVQIRDSGMRGKLKKRRHDSGFLVSLEFQFLAVSIPLLPVFYKFVH